MQPLLKMFARMATSNLAFVSCFVFLFFVAAVVLCNESFKAGGAILLHI